MKRTILLTAIGLAILVFAFIPYAIYGVFNVGVWGLALFGAAVAALPHLHRLMKAMPKIRKIVFAVINAVFALGLCIVVGVLIYMQSYPTAEMPEDATVVVLGCQVKEYGPSLMLSGRLEAAKEYLDAHPKALCIVSGGQGETEPMSEADAMAQWLAEHGIDESRILREDKSTNTNENLQYSAELIQECGLSENVVVVTDGFHALRGCLCAKRYGLTASAYTADAPWFLVQSYWLREILGIMKYYFLEQ